MVKNVESVIVIMQPAMQYYTYLAQYIVWSNCWKQDGHVITKLALCILFYLYSIFRRRYSRIVIMKSESACSTAVYHDGGLTNRR